MIKRYELKDIWKILDNKDMLYRQDVAFNNREDITLTMSLIEDIVARKEPYDPGDIVMEEYVWRGETNRMGKSKETLKDILEFEAYELGNTLVAVYAERVLDKYSASPEKIPGKEALWVSPYYTVAKLYDEDPIKIELDEPYIVISRDDEYGYLILPLRYLKTL